jgi:hypothetical protein
MFRKATASKPAPSYAKDSANAIKSARAGRVGFYRLRKKAWIQAKRLKYIPQELKKLRKRAWI